MCSPRCTRKGTGLPGCWVGRWAQEQFTNHLSGKLAQHSRRRRRGPGLEWLVGGVTPALAPLLAPDRPGGWPGHGVHLLPRVPECGGRGHRTCQGSPATLLDSTHHVMPAGPSGCEVPLRLAGGATAPGGLGRAGTRPSLCRLHCVYGAGLSSLPSSCTSWRRGESIPLPSLARD